jgi:hypothetical protein
MPSPRMIRNREGMLRVIDVKPRPAGCRPRHRPVSDWQARGAPRVVARPAQLRKGRIAYL